jgi:hypothetical protein
VTLMPNKAADPHPAIPERGGPIQMDTFNAGSRCYAIMVSGEPLGVLRSHFGFADAQWAFGIRRHSRSLFNVCDVTHLGRLEAMSATVAAPTLQPDRMSANFCAPARSGWKQSAKTLPSSPLSACLPSVGCRLPSTLTTGLTQLARMPV